MIRVLYHEMRFPVNGDPKLTLKMVIIILLITTFFLKEKHFFDIVFVSFWLKQNIEKSAWKSKYIYPLKFGKYTIFIQAPYEFEYLSEFSIRI